MPMLYDEVGGSEFFVRLVDRFYEGVVQDDVLWPLYPDHEDLAGARERLTLFLMNVVTRVYASGIFRLQLAS
jgi:hemoglobin